MAHAVAESESLPRSPSRTARWPRRAVTALAALYPVLLLATIAAFRFVGERWWVTAVGLYVPRAAFLAPLPLLLFALLIAGSRRGAWVLLGGSRSRSFSGSWGSCCPGEPA